jgi:two-component system cell cycle response regulator
MLQSSREDAATDALTGLANRRQLDRDLAELFRVPDAPEERMLMLLDLNGFKLYNDTFGHPAGDALLARISDHLTRAVNGRGKAYRMGGDEFCVLTHAEGDAASERVARTIAAALSERGEGFTIDASYGWVILPREASDPDLALRIVDQRMYAQKEGGRVSARAQSKNVLVQALLERSPDLTEHLSAVSSMAVATGQRLGLGETELETIEVAGALHDIGKVAIPDEILNKMGPLNDEEWQYVKRHSIVGERIVGAAPALEGVARIVRSVHERVDGAGYPDQLLGADIPLGSRILAVVDAFHAMTSGDRPYRTAIDEASAFAELDRCAGTQFDVDVVAAFFHTRAHDGEGPGGSTPEPRPPLLPAQLVGPTGATKAW